MSALRSVAAVAAALAVLAVMQRTAPGYADITRPIAVSGAFGERLAGRQFAIRTERLRFGRSLVYEAYGRRQALTTSGVWALLDVSAEAVGDTVAITAANWQTPNGASYAASQRVSSFPAALASLTLQPGLERRGVLVFELPRDQTGGGVVRITRTAFAPLDSEIEIDMSGAGTIPVEDEIALSAGGDG